MRAQIQVADLNYDGKKDLLLGNGLVEQSRIYYYENTGTNASPVLAEEAELQYKNNNPIYPDSGYDIYFCVADWNEDGGFDIIWTDYYGDVGLKLCLGDVPVEIHQFGDSPYSDILNNYILRNGYFSTNIILKKAEYIKLSMVTADGRTVKTKDIGSLHAGNHKVVIDLNAHPSGVYFIKLFADDICVENKRLLFVK